MGSVRRYLAQASLLYTRRALDGLVKLRPVALGYSPLPPCFSLRALRLCGRWQLALVRSACHPAHVCFAVNETRVGCGRQTRTC